MLTAELNERLTEVGPGTPMGRLLRCYWHPIGAVAELEANPVKPVKLLGESLVLYRDGGGRLGLLAEACMHRRASLAYGIPEPRGLRCPYHGWLYDLDGTCLEQPAEPTASSFKEKIQITSYPVRDLGGLVFAYLGELPAPVLPRYKAFVWDDAIHEIQGSVIAANWLQVLENLVDPVHVEYLHGRFFSYVLDRLGDGRAEEFRQHHAPGHVRRIAFERFDRGMIERYMVKDELEPKWRWGTATFFPTMVMSGSERRAELNFVVPLDDTHSWFLVHVSKRLGVPLPAQRAIRFGDVPGTDTHGQFILDMANGQDHMATVTQGEITRRDLEHLGTSDLGIILYRELLVEQLERMEHRKELMNVHRGREGMGTIDFPRVQAPGRADLRQAQHRGGPRGLRAAELGSAAVAGGPIDSPERRQGVLA